MKLKLNPELCPENELSNKRFQFGQLGYFVFFLQFKFDLVEEFKDACHGDMYKLSNEEFKNGIVFRKEDCILVKN